MNHDRQLHILLPNDDNDKIQQVPAVADVGARVHNEPVGQDLEEGFHCEDDEEHVLNLFLQQTNHTTASASSELNRGRNVGKERNT